jgi:GDP-L-fucose synthase
MSEWANRRVLVTGGAGFVGSYLVEQLVAAGARVRVADNLESGRRENLSAVWPDIEFTNVDLRDRSRALKACAGQEFVFNLAAKITGIGYSRLHHAEMFDTNMLLLQNGLRAAHQAGVTKFCQVSSACVYPADARVPTPEDEGHRGEPEPANAGYGWAKRMGEVLAAYYAAETAMRVVVVRPFNAYGPRDHFEAETAHVIPALVKKVLDGDDPIEVWGSGTQTRSFIHARELATGIRQVMEQYDRPDPINVGADSEVSIRALIEKIQALSGSRTQVVYNTAMPEGYRRRAPDISRLREITGGGPSIPLDEGLAETVAWYQAQMRGEKA